MKPSKTTNAEKKHAIAIVEDIYGNKVDAILYSLNFFSSGKIDHITVGNSMNSERTTIWMNRDTPKNNLEKTAKVKGIYIYGKYFSINDPSTP